MTIAPLAATAGITPLARARLLYAEAHSAAEAGLWQAAMDGDAASGPAAIDRAYTARTARSADDALSALLLHLRQETRLPPAPSLPMADQSAPRAGTNGREPDRRSDGAVDRPSTGSGGYGEALRLAATRTGVPAPVIAAIIDAEAGRDGQGRWQPLSRNPRSSAVGLGQFLSKTWRQQADLPGTWLNGVARERGWLNDHGHVRGEAKADLLALRYDARASIETTADFARLNLTLLRKNGAVFGNDHGGLANAAYLAHHLGLRDAVRFLGSGLDPAHAGRLLTAQIGKSAADRQIRFSGDAAVAHRTWLLHYMDRRLRPGGGGNAAA